ncbi:venom serine carboxypeptidase-like isoform X2 [Homalodisca vitripennis]|uniref:venom serine carboxypeptidase-like isoform X2 n=1 Tax=Homalodisca vitripennis TaxID=197043 RepID=UPI001EEC5B3E|nr:venom serine carboxypeptidase-like isoform X2 [Homalodisca vitripennis]
MLYKLQFLTFLTFSHSVYSFLRPTLITPLSPKTDEDLGETDEDIGETLYLTPLLEKGDYKNAQLLSKVEPDIGNVTSYSGFFTVNKECGSNLFFWFFPAQKENWRDAPLILWLQGGPGATSLYGIFEEIGPFSSYEEGLEKRNSSWNTDHNLLIIDQPVGVGFSFTDKDCYAKNETDVGEDLYRAVVQFHELFPNFQQNKFFIFGESYAGHYIPALGHTIHKYNPSASVKINLAAMAIGNGFSDAKTQFDYGNYLYYIGLVDDAGKNEYMKYYNDFLVAVEDKSWSEASKIHQAFMGDLYEEYVSSKVNMYNYLPGEPKERQNWIQFMNSANILKALHIGALSFHIGNDAYEALLLDIVQSVKPWVEELLEVYPIVFYNGQLDIICGYPMMIKFLRSLNWSGQSQYLNATRTKWCEGEELAGYYKGVHNLYDVLVRDAGHMVPADQPLWAYTLMNSITSGTPDNPLHALTPC